MLFTREQCTWITLEYVKTPSPIIVKRELVMCRGITPTLYLGSQISKVTPQENKPRNTREPHLFNLSNCKKVWFFQWSSRKILQKELKVKPFSFTDAINWVKTTNSSAWYFVTGFVIGTAQRPDLIPLDYWFWGAMDKLIYLQKTNSIPTLKRLFYEAAREISGNAVKRAVANITAEFTFSFVTMVLISKPKCN